MNHLYTEAQSLLREYLPIARRVLGRDDRLTFFVTEQLATAIAQYGAAPREDLLESIEMHTELIQGLRRVMGAQHPMTRRNEGNLRLLREYLARLG
jgi:hypothetical protein